MIILLKKTNKINNTMQIEYNNDDIEFLEKDFAIDKKENFLSKGDINIKNIEELKESMKLFMVKKNIKKITSLYKTRNIVLYNVGIFTLISIITQSLWKEKAQNIYHIATMVVEELTEKSFIIWYDNYIKAYKAISNYNIDLKAKTGVDTAFNELFPPIPIPYTDMKITPAILKSCALSYVQWMEYFYDNLSPTDYNDTYEAKIIKQNLDCFTPDCFILYYDCIISKKINNSYDYKKFSDKNNIYRIYSITPQDWTRNHSYFAEMLLLLPNSVISKSNNIYYIKKDIEFAKKLSTRNLKPHSIYIVNQNQDIYTQIDPTVVRFLKNNDIYIILSALHVKNFIQASLTNSIISNTENTENPILDIYSPHPMLKYKIDFIKLSKLLFKNKYNHKLTLLAINTYNKMLNKFYQNYSIVEIIEHHRQIKLNDPIIDDDKDKMTRWWAWASPSQYIPKKHCVTNQDPEMHSKLEKLFNILKYGTSDPICTLSSYIKKQIAKI